MMSTLVLSIIMGFPPGLGELSAVAKKVELHPVLTIIVHF